ncbi:MAG: hypothetical protein ABI844_07885 [Saprospiraceae bacterium]
MARQISLFIAISLWAIIIGGVVYSHIVYFPPYLSHLPESNKLITGEYGLSEGNFWMFIHPVAFLSTIFTLILNWKLKPRRRFILISLSIYIAALMATALYFVPGLTAFANSNNNTSISVSEWFQRGQAWQHWSWLRGFFMFSGFISLLIGLTKNQ